MPVVVDSHRRVTVEPHEATRGLTGRIFARRDPQRDPGDTVTVLGVTLVGSVDPRPELVVACTTFGAIPAGWDAASESFDLDSFAEQYRDITGAETAALKVDALAAAEEATEAAAERESPWSRS
jgi:hypothetical protein